MNSTQQIDELIAGYDDWRGELLAELRATISSVDKNLTEEVKWGVPVWTSKGLVCAISAFKDHVKINFFKGAQLPDPKRIFNSGQDSKEHRSINISKDQNVDLVAIKDLVKSAIKLNENSK